MDQNTEEQSTPPAGDVDAAAESADSGPSEAARPDSVRSEKVNSETVRSDAAGQEPATIAKGPGRSLLDTVREWSTEAARPTTVQGGPPMESQGTRSQGASPLQRQRPIECVLVGPSGVGKTALIGALGPAMCLPRDDPRALRVIPRDAAVTVETSLVESVAGKSIGSASDLSEVAGDPDRHQEHQFEFDVGPAAGGPLRRVTFYERALSWPPVSGDQDEQFQPLKKLEVTSLSPRSDRCLVVLFDGARVQTGSWYRTLPAMVDRLTRLPENDPARRAIDAQGRARFDRILLMVTKIDLVCPLVQKIPAGVCSRLERLGIDLTSPDQIVQRLDPVALVTARIGERWLNRLAALAYYSAPIAAGVTSVTGFELAGAPEDRQDEDLENQRLLSWRPYGVLDALRFIAMGRVEGSLRNVGRARGSVHGDHQAASSGSTNAAV